MDQKQIRFGNGLALEGIEKEFVKALNQPSKIRNFKTKI
jgi:hypothetical protein